MTADDRPPRVNLAKLPDPNRGAPRSRPLPLDGRDDIRCDTVDRPTGRRCLRRQHPGGGHQYLAPAAFQDVHSPREPTEVRRPRDEYL